MTTIHLSVDGPSAHEVISNVLNDLSYDESNSVSVAIQFGDFSLSAESDSISAAAERFNSITYNDNPTGFDVTIELPDDVGAVEQVNSNVAEIDDEADDDDDTDKRDHTAADPAHLRANTMEHLTLNLLAEYLCYVEDADNAFGVTGIMVDPRDIVSWDGAPFDINVSQAGNALFRLWKKGLVERERGGGGTSRRFGYEFNRAGAAEVERLGGIDPDSFSLPEPDDGDE